MRMNRVLMLGASMLAAALPFMRSTYEPTAKPRFHGKANGKIPQPRSLNPRAKKQYWLKGVRP